jgi:hypothetical protein
MKGSERESLKHFLTGAALEPSVNSGPKASFQGDVVFGALRFVRAWRLDEIPHP